jgi:NADH-quinone oxidoreductase subunit N
MSYVLLLPELLLVVVSLGIVILGLFMKKEHKKILGYLSILALLAALSVVLGTFNISSTFLYNAFVVDKLAQFFNVLFLSVGILVCIASLKYYENHPNQDEYFSLILMATVGMMTVAMANDLITLFVGFELASISTYILAGFDKDKRTLEATMKYFIIGALSSSLLLFGISLIYGLTGSTNLTAISTTLVSSPVATVAMILILAGFGFKMSLVPFHMWAPDTYEGAPSVVSAFLAAGSKKMGFIAAFRVFIVALVAIRLEWYLPFAILAVITMTLGNVVAIVQGNIKRMLAYSSVAHAGYIAIAFVVVSKSPLVAQQAVAGGILHALSHAIATAGAFLVTSFVASVILLNGGSRGEEIESYSGLGRSAPITALMMAFLLGSLAGIPPTFGFYSKFVLFLSAIRGDLLWLAIIAVLNSALSVYYYIRVVMKMYWGEPIVGKVEEPKHYVVALALAALGVIILGVYPSKIYDLALSAANNLLGGL